MIRKSRTCVLNMPMNEGQGDPHDSSGYGNNGTNNGADWVSGDYGWAMEFNGSSDYVDCGNDASLSINNNTMTISLWIYPFSFSALSYESNIVSKEHGNSEYTVRIGTGKATFNIRSDIGSWIQAQSPTPILVEEWHHICGVLDGSNVYIYVDNIEKDQTVWTGNVVNNALDFHVGKIASADSRHFHGIIDDALIYNRARSSAERSDYFNATKARYGL